MSLRPLSDVSAANWLMGHDVGSLGPSGFEAYARVLHPWLGGPTESTHERADGYLPDEQLDALCDVLGRHTGTPDSCFFGLWDGYGDLYGGESVAFLTAFAGPAAWPGRVFKPAKPAPPPPPAFSSVVIEGPRLSLPSRDYLLFGGPLADAGDWGATGYGLNIPRDLNSPNLIWPSDRLWFVSTEVEGSWTGVGGSTSAIDDLLRDERLEVVRTRYEDRS